MSVLNKKWIIKKSSLEKIFKNRRVSCTQNTFSDPFLFKDMKKAVARIHKAIKNNQRIMIFGDYDVDGITGTAIAFHILKKLKAKVSYRLPHRVEDGYGLSEKFVKDFTENKVDLLITVDCGISCAKIIQKIKENQIDTIITDHHTIPKNPPKHAFAILHHKELTGAGVALKLAHALILKNFPREKHEKLLKPLIDLAALGTVADLGSLTGENWLIVKKGLANLHNTEWVGLKKIMQLAEIKEKHNIDSDTIGFRIAPRINAAGRIDDPYLALSLILQEELSEKVHLLGNKLEKLNSERKKMTIKAVEEAEESLKTAKVFPFIIIAENSDWHVGILGLIAGRLAEKYSRPTIIMQDFGDILVASARSPKSFNIIKALTAHAHCLTTFGGHAQAAGFSILSKNLGKFKRGLTAYAKEKLKNMDLTPILEIDSEIGLEEINFLTMNELEKLKPFGVDNKKPTFLLREIEPYFINKVGKEKNHLKFAVKTGNQNVDAVGFHLGEFADTMRQHRKIDIAFNLERSNWNNHNRLELHVVDFRGSES